MKMFMELRRLISDYARLAVKYDKQYQQALDFIEQGQWIEAQVPLQVQHGITPEEMAGGVKLRTGGGEEVSLAEIVSRKFGIVHVNSVKDQDTVGLRARWVKRLRLFEWGLFDYKRLSELVKKQEEWVARLIALMKFALLPIISQDVGELQQLITGEKATLGFSALAKTRLAILNQLGDINQEIDAKLLQSVGTPLAKLPNTSSRRLLQRKLYDSIVLIEYKIYQLPFGESNGPNLDIARQRIQCISRMLNVGYENNQVGGEQLAHLHCQGYFHEREKHRFGLIYAVPTGCDPIPVSLNYVISSRDFRGASRPSLGERFQMAQKIGKALLEWFLVDWVHKSISSMDVAFFRKSSASTDTVTYDFSNPYLCGFEYARQSQGVSNDTYGPVEFEQMVYRHPARQGVPTETFRKIHDVYAFGVLLLEIGLWQVARDMFPSKLETRGLLPGNIKKELVRNAKERLGHYMGCRYKKVVLACLEGTFGFDLEEDNTKGTKLMTAFREVVLNALDEGGAGLSE